MLTYRQVYRQDRKAGRHTNIQAGRGACKKRTARQPDRQTYIEE